MAAATKQNMCVGVIVVESKANSWPTRTNSSLGNAIAAIVS